MRRRTTSDTADGLSRRRLSFEREVFAIAPVVNGFDPSEESLEVEQLARPAVTGARNGERATNLVESEGGTVAFVKRHESEFEAIRRIVWFDPSLEGPEIFHPAREGGRWKETTVGPAGAPIIDACLEGQHQNRNEYSIGLPDVVGRCLYSELFVVSLSVVGKVRTAVVPLAEVNRFQ